MRHQLSASTVSTFGPDRVTRRAPAMHLAKGVTWVGRAWSAMPRSTGRRPTRHARCWLALLGCANCHMHQWFNRTYTNGWLGGGGFPARHQRGTGEGPGLSPSIGPPGSRGVDGMPAIYECPGGVWGSAAGSPSRRRSPKVRRRRGGWALDAPRGLIYVGHSESSIEPARTPQRLPD